MAGSMGMLGAASDIAAMESISALLQKNARGRLAPIEPETIMTTPAAQVAWPNLSPFVQQSYDFSLVAGAQRCHKESTGSVATLVS